MRLTINNKETSIWLTEQFEISRSGVTDNLRSMEGLRGLAVFLVFLVHYMTLVQPWLAPGESAFRVSKGLHTMGNLGVELFFVLSGYLIYGSLLARTQPFPSFMRRRMIRIYPTYIVVFAAYLVLATIFPQESRIPKDPLDAALFLVSNFLLLPGIFPLEGFISVAWSLSYEVFFYGLVPLLIAMFRMRERSVTWRVLFFVSLTIFMIVMYWFWGGPVRMVMFISGMLVYEAVEANFLDAPASLAGALALLFVLFGSIPVIPGNPGVAIKEVLFFLGFWLLCFTCFANSRGWLAQAFGWKPLRWLGNMSYSFYLLHGLTLKAGFFILAKLFPPTQVFGFPWLVGWFIPLFFVATVTSALLYVLIERPYSLKKPVPAFK